jgi:hypothetical protein
MKGGDRALDRSKSNRGRRQRRRRRRRRRRKRGARGIDISSTDGYLYVVDDVAYS